MTENELIISLLRKCLEECKANVIRHTALGQFDAADEYSKTAREYQAKLDYRLANGRAMPLA